MPSARGVVAATTGLLGLSSTKRAAVLAVVVCALALTVAVPLRNYVAQRQELAAVSEQQRALAAEVDRARPGSGRGCRTRPRSRRRRGPGWATSMPGEVPVRGAASGRARPGTRPTGPARACPWYRVLWREVRGGTAVSRGAASSEQGIADEDLDGGRRAARPADRARCARWRTGARAGCPRWCRPRRGCEDGTPFPTLYYLTCSRLSSRIGGLEAAGRMREMTERLAEDPELAAAYRRAHEAYLAERDAIEPLGTERQRRRDARPGQVPARPRGARAGRRPGREPVRRRGAGRGGRVVAAGPCAPTP